MPAISARYAAALPYSHNIATLAEVRSGGQLLGTFQPEPGGSVSVDIAAAVRRTCKVSLVDPTGTLTPRDATSIFSPYGHEIVLYRGITYTDGTQELVQLGVFGIETAEINDTGSDLVINITGSDRAAAIARAKLQDVYTIPASTNGSAAIGRLLGTARSGMNLQYALAPTSYYTPNAPIVLKAGDDVWAQAQLLAQAAGMQLFFDVYGVCTLQIVPDPAVKAVAWSYDEGEVNMALGLKRTLSRATVANIVIRDGQGTGTGTPVRGFAQDNNQSSPTYVNGTYGQVVDYASSSMLLTQAQAQAVANADLLLLLGSVETLTIQTIPNPGHDCGDVIEVKRARANIGPVNASGVNVGGGSAFYVVDSFKMPLDHSGVVDMTCRRVARTS